MKKSKIIVPALGILAFSTAAAVTGTVAWFTASRQATISNSAITAFNPEEGLQITLSAPTEGVTLTTPGAAQAVAAEHKLLRDGSVDISTDTHKVYGSELGEDGSVAGFAEKASPFLAGTKVDGTTKYYYATKYTATFNLSAQSSNDQYALIYDNGELVATGSSAIKAALRIGIRNDANDEYMVIAPFRNELGYNYNRATDVTSSNYDEKKGSLYTESAGVYTPVGAAAYDAGKTYYYRDALTSESFINNTVKASVTGSYAGVTVYANNDNASAVGSHVANLAAISSNIGFLGTLQGTGTIATSVYTWFEGCDPDCVNNNVDAAALTSALTFRIVKLDA